MNGNQMSSYQTVENLSVFQCSKFSYNASIERTMPQLYGGFLNPTDLRIKKHSHAVDLLRSPYICKG